MKYQNLYQFLLIFFCLLFVLGVGVFIYYELFPEYKIYQYAYKDLEEFRSSYMREPPPPFKTGIKQILIPDNDQGPELIDRCISCHVSIDLPHFSPTSVALDVNDNPIIDTEGNPVLEPNSNYIFTKLDERIAELEKAGDQVAADELKSLQISYIDGRKTDISKALIAHPLIGKETRPFEFHPMDEYGCTSCHSGNGRALEFKHAHGPVFDEDYEPADMGFTPQFLEKDPENDPAFSRMYNHKPGHELAFQTTPILSGPLIAAKCVQCHQSSSAEVKSAIEKIDIFTGKKEAQLSAIEEGITHDQKALESLVILKRSLDEKGYQGTVDWLNEQLGNYHLPAEQIDAYEGQMSYVKAHSSNLQEEIQRDLLVTQQRMVAKQHVLTEERPTYQRFERSTEPLERLASDSQLVKEMGTDVDRLITNYTRGKELFVSQACYACHRIAGFSRSSVGPELTEAGDDYPWELKEAIVWPQGDLPSSTMPNFRLDHDELSDLLTFLLAQTGETKAVSEVDHQISIEEWESGAKMPWEEPVPPTKIEDVRAGMHVFATQGCAACHKLEGFESNVGFTGDDPIADEEWFTNLFPEHIRGSILAQVVEENGTVIDEKIADHVRSDGLLEELEVDYPGLVSGFYPNFSFAERARNAAFKEDPAKLVRYLERLRKVLMIYIEQYGLGRDIAPPLNWSGVYRDDAWLLGHFHNPSAYTARSIMPVMPFDDTKFYQLNHMLHVLGAKNRDKLREIWRREGFNPPLAYELLCSACHGEQRQGNGFVSEWIYPIPKNLRNPIFLRNLTKARAIDSITHGVKGTPMPPWGEVASPEELPPVLTYSEIVQLVDWIYQGLPEETRAESHEDYEKWDYNPDEVVEEMEAQHDLLQPAPEQKESVQQLVHTYFRTEPNPIPGPDPSLYYIREDFYTPENLAAGEAYYLVNCASCHGKEGTGTGLRATSMVEAKPRMLTNLPWLRTRDDLRLLRSIKYGVPGTAMIPWGDQTTSTQRMQLVMFIRELTRTQIHQDDLAALLYTAFDYPIQVIEEARVGEYALLEEKEKRLKSIEERLFNLSESSSASAEGIGELYTEKVSLERAVKAAEVVDGRYKKLIVLLKEERTIFHQLGEQMIAIDLSASAVEAFLALLEDVKPLYTFEEGKLTLSYEWEDRDEQEILALLEKKITTYQGPIDALAEKIQDPARGEGIQKLMNEQAVYINFKTKLIIQLSAAKALQEKQTAIIKAIHDHPNDL